MKAIRYLSQITVASLLLGTSGCANLNAAPPNGKSATASSGPALVSPPSSKPSAQTQMIETQDFALPLPADYADMSSAFKKKAPHLVVGLEANKLSDGYQPTIVILKAPIPGGSFADPSTCSQTGKGLVTGGTEDPGTGGTLLSASIIDGPLGKTCQIQLRAPEGIALITELHETGNTPLTPHDIWLMTCNYADGDKIAEATCRSTLAGFRLRNR
jgi:hypothetical protein